MINICKVLNGQCRECPFCYKCGFDFDGYNTKEHWLKELNDMLHIIENAIKKVEIRDE